jgi:serine/threonine protein kinase
MPKERSIDGLPAGYALDCYVIDSILGQGGFGITYLARDRRDGPNERWVALKEYFPVNSAARTRDARVWPRSRSDCGEFRYGLHRFIKEAEILTRFSHPNIVKVWRLIENNGTAYMVMSFEEGEQLDKALKRHPGGLPEADIVRLFAGIVDGLGLVHSSGHLHRDLAPDNIIIRWNRTPVIIDFGAARCSFGHRSKSIDAIIKCGYSPPEQYTLEHKNQGPWTDVYALGAIAYRCIGGPTPAGSLDRQHMLAEQGTDLLPTAAMIGRGRYSPTLLAAIDRAMALRWSDRPSSAAEWYELLAGRCPYAASRSSAGEPASGLKQGFFPRLLRSLFPGRAGNAAQPARGMAAGHRSWTLSGTDSTGAPFQTTVSEPALRSAHGTLIIGRDQAMSDIVIPDGTVSRRHAILSIDEQGLYIQDANSMNGTSVDGVPLTGSVKPAPLGDRARVQLGGANLVVSIRRTDGVA